LTQYGKIHELEEAVISLRRKQTIMCKALKRERLVDLRAINVQIQEENQLLKESTAKP
jgi:hypothetical protein